MLRSFCQGNLLYQLAIVMLGALNQSILLTTPISASDRKENKYTQVNNPHYQVDPVYITK